MLKVTLKNKILVVENPPFGKVSLSREYMKLTKKEDFKETHKTIDAEGIWESVKDFEAKETEAKNAAKEKHKADLIATKEVKKTK